MIDNPASRLAPSFLPATAVVELTYQCNHGCLFCSCPWENDGGDFERREELSSREWQAAIHKLSGMGVTNIAFTGGEPLLKEGLWDIAKAAASCLAEHVETVDGRLQSEQRPPNLYLLSNGTAVTTAVLQRCKQLGIQLSMSLPGLATYREHTQAGDPDTILTNFREAKRIGLPTVVNVTVTSLNIHELYETISAAFLAGADQLLMNRFLPGGRGLANADRLMLSNEQIGQMLDTAEQVLREAARFGSVGTELPKCVVDTSRYERLEVGTRCAAALSFFVIGPSGYVRTCNHSPVRLAHVNDIDSVRTDPYWMRFTQKDYLPAMCSGCGAMAACDGGCREAAHIVGGSIDSPDPALV